MCSDMENNSGLLRPHGDIPAAMLTSDGSIDDSKTHVNENGIDIDRIGSETA